MQGRSGWLANSVQPGQRSSPSASTTTAPFTLGCASSARSARASSGSPATSRYCLGTSPPKRAPRPAAGTTAQSRSEEHTSELQVTNAHLVCRLLLEKKKNKVAQQYTRNKMNKQIN